VKKCDSCAVRQGRFKWAQDGVELLLCYSCKHWAKRGKILRIRSTASKTGSGNLS
jgi:hypothetical protein